jgi:FkbM family methyltransferase
MEPPSIFDGLFEALAETWPHHARDGALHPYLARWIGAKLRETGLREGGDGVVDLGPLGTLTFPFERMGGIDSLDLFGLDELILFSFYLRNRGRYRRVVDIGANLGLHSLVLARCGFTVRAFEPDPHHAALFAANMERNRVKSVELLQAAVSDRDGEMEFVRVKGNTTGSHLAGAKASPYGELERFAVRVQAAAAALEGCDFAKIDAEGHEPTILKAVPAHYWNTLDVMVEIGTPINADIVFQHFDAMNIGMYPQKRNWTRARSAEDLPHSHREGSLFISSRGEAVWRGA